jgi:hypothetical protein
MKDSLYPKGYAGRQVSYASGGAVLGRTRDFLKSPDRFRENQGNTSNFGKGEGKSNPKAEDKSLPAVKPQT